MLLLSSCTNLYDPESSQDQHGDVIANLLVNDQFIQSFVSGNQGLSLIEFWINASPDPVSGVGKFNISLYKGVEEATPIYNATVRFTTKLESSQQNIELKPQFGAENQAYHLTISAEEGSIQLLGRNENINPNGNAWFNFNSLDADMGIALSYEYGYPVLLKDVVKLLPSAWLFFPIIFIFFIPGWLLLKISGLNKHNDFGENTALSLGLSISFFAILISWTSFLNLHWNRISFILFSSFISIIFLYFLLLDYKSRFKFAVHQTTVLLILIFLVALATRLIMVRDLVAPAWVDSVQHALITRLIIDQGALPKSFQPYLELSSSAYHSGLHGLFAFFYWLTNIEVHRLILILGQFLNAFFIFSAYLFTNSLLKNRTAALVSAVIVAVLSPMPIYYTSWGRYPQLAGLAIFPVSVSFLHQSWKLEKTYGSQSRSFFLFRIIPVFGITVAGMTLTHYRVIIFFFCYLIAELITHYFRFFIFRESYKPNSLSIVTLLSVGFLSLLFLIPWLANITTELFSYQLIPQSAIPPFKGLSIDYLTTANGWLVLIFSGIGLVLGLIMRKKFIFILGIWVGFLFFLANMGVFRLPGSTFINNNSVIISLFLPLSVLAGYAVSSILFFCQKQIGYRFKAVFNFIVLLISCVVLYFGASQIITILNPITFLAREADFKAMPAIRTITNDDDTILINPFLWGYNLYAGSDGGYWISASAGRRTMPPPVLYGLSNQTSYRQMVNKISSESIMASNKPDVLARLMRENGIQYIYLGSRGGVFSAQKIIQSNDFIVRYHQDNVWLFQVTYPSGISPSY